MLVKKNIEEVLKNLQEKITIKIDSNKSKICISYFNHTFKEKNYIILKKDKVNYNEISSFLYDCLPNYDVVNMTLYQLNILNEKIINLYL